MGALRPDCEPFWDQSSGQVCCNWYSQASLSSAVHVQKRRIMHKLYACVFVGFANFQVRFGKGCFLGIPLLLASSDLDIGGLPRWEVAAAEGNCRCMYHVLYVARLTSNFQAFMRSYGSDCRVTPRK